MGLKVSIFIINKEKSTSKKGLQWFVFLNWQVKDLFNGILSRGVLLQVFLDQALCLVKKEMPCGKKVFIHKLPYGALHICDEQWFIGADLNAEY